MKAGRHHTHRAPAESVPLGIAIATVGVHTVAMVATALLLAVNVYSIVGVGVSRKAWIHPDWIWAGALVITGAVTLATGVMEVAGV